MNAQQVYCMVDRMNDGRKEEWKNEYKNVFWELEKEETPLEW